MRAGVMRGVLAALLILVPAITWADVAPPPAAAAKARADKEKADKEKADKEKAAKARDGGAPDAKVDAGTASDAGALPPGHPTIGGDDEDDDEPPNPHGDDPHGASPHGGDPHGASPHGGSMEDGLFRAPPDTAEDDPTLPVGTLVATIKDARDKPVASTDVTLGILHSSVAKGDSRERKTATADGNGTLRWDNLEFGSGTTYRLSVAHAGATFANTPFPLSDKAGKRVVLHTYDVTESPDGLLMGMQAMVYMQLREDSIQVEHLFTIYNYSPQAWLANAEFALPSGFKAFNKPDSMEDIAFEATKEGAALRGTITPGRHDVNFRYQVPLDETEKQTLKLGLPPHVAQMRVIAEASKTMGLSVGGFPPAQKTQNREGKHVLVTEHQVSRADGGVKSVEMTLTGLPTPGNGRWIAVALGIFSLVGGFAYLLQTRGERDLDDDAREDLVEAREALLGEIVLLEKMHKKGEIGPKTYARLRAELLDALARIVGMLDEAEATKKRERAPRRRAEERRAT